MKDTNGKLFSTITQEALMQASPERLKEFAQIAGERTSDGLYKYKGIALAINHPRFDLIKKIADIEINGKNPYAQIAGNLFMHNEKELENLYNFLVSTEPNVNKRSELIKQINRKFLTVTNTEQLKVLLGV